MGGGWVGGMGREWEGWEWGGEMNGKRMEGWDEGEKRRRRRQGLFSGRNGETTHMSNGHPSITSHPPPPSPPALYHR